MCSSTRIICNFYWERRFFLLYETLLAILEFWWERSSSVFFGGSASSISLLFLYFQLWPTLFLLTRQAAEEASNHSGLNSIIWTRIPNKYAIIFYKPRADKKRLLWSQIPLKKTNREYSLLGWEWHICESQFFIFNMVSVANRKHTFTQMSPMSTDSRSHPWKP